MAKYTVSGTRNADVISVGDTGVTKNGAFIPLTAAQIDAGIIINGNAGNDRLTGGRGPDELNGAGGADTLRGGGGYDLLLGGAGNDTLSDSLTGAYIDGGRGTDTLDFSASASGVAVYSQNVETGVTVQMLDGSVEVTHAGQQFANRIFNTEVLVGSGYNDVLWAGNGSDTIRGGAGDDFLNGLGLGSDLDKLYGEAGNDLLAANEGVDHMTGGAGADRFSATTAPS